MSDHTSRQTRVKITVLKRFSTSEVFETLPATPVSESAVKACPYYEDDQKFIVGFDQSMPVGFCTSAWDSVYCSVKILAYGGNKPWFKEKGVAIVCCTDGLRPVIFKLERI